MSKRRSIDVHGCTVPEAISQFIDFYNDSIRIGYQGFVEVIHGYGSSGQGGAIKTALQKYLASHSDYLEMFILGEAIDNPGITKVYPKKQLPVNSNDTQSPIREAILRFCESPKAKAKIVTKLRSRFGDRALQDEMSRMVRDGLLREANGKLERI